MLDHIGEEHDKIKRHVCKCGKKFYRNEQFSRHKKRGKEGCTPVHTRVTKHPHSQGEEGGVGEQQQEGEEQQQKEQDEEERNEFSDESDFQ